MKNMMNQIVTEKKKTRPRPPKLEDACLNLARLRSGFLLPEASHTMRTNQSAP